MSLRWRGLIGIVTAVLVVTVAVGSIVVWTNRAVDNTGDTAFRVAASLLADIYATPAANPPAAQGGS